MTKITGEGDPISEALCDKLDLIVEQAKRSDAMFEKYGIDEEEYNSAFSHYNLNSDPEISTVIMQNMRKI